MYAVYILKKSSLKKYIDKRWEKLEYNSKKYINIINI